MKRPVKLLVAGVFGSIGTLIFAVPRVISGVITAIVSLFGGMDAFNLFASSVMEVIYGGYIIFALVLNWISYAQVDGQLAHRSGLIYTTVWIIEIILMALSMGNLVGYGVVSYLSLGLQILILVPFMVAGGLLMVGAKDC